jgi:hypothetical protein
VFKDIYLTPNGGHLHVEVYLALLCNSRPIRRRGRRRARRLEGLCSCGGELGDADKPLIHEGGFLRRRADSLDEFAAT